MHGTFTYEKIKIKCGSTRNEGTVKTNIVGAGGLWESVEEEAP